MGMNRRAFLRLVGAGSAGVALAQVPLGSPEAPARTGELRRDADGRVFVRVVAEGPIMAGDLVVFTRANRVRRATRGDEIDHIGVMTAGPWVQIYGPAFVRVVV